MLWTWMWKQTRSHEMPDTQSELPNKLEMPPPDDDKTHEGGENSTEDDVDTEGGGNFIPPPTVEDKDSL
jgi:hypothetical protein